MKPVLTALLLSCAMPLLAYEVHLDFAWVNDMAVDPTGNVYLIGTPLSSLLLRPDNYPQVLEKLDPAGNLLYTVNLGELTYRAYNLVSTGFGINVNAIALDKTGGLYIAGWVNQAGLATANAAQPAPGGMADAFIAKWSSDGGLIYFTYLGGSGTDRASKIAVDPDGNVYVTGDTCSRNFPTVNAAQAAFGGSPGEFRCDAFATKLDAGGSLVYSTYLGGTRLDYGLAIAADTAGNAYVAGSTSSADFPTLNAFQPDGTCTTYNCSDGFLVKLDASGALVYSSYLGGTGFEQANAVGVDAGGNAWVAGATGSCDVSIVQGYQSSPGDSRCEDAFIARTDPNGQLIYSSYLGGNGYDHAEALTIDGDGNLYVTGGSCSSDFPTLNPLQPSAVCTGFITKLDSSGSTLLFSSYFGNTLEERETIGFATALDASGNLYIAAAIRGGAVDGDFVLKIDLVQ
jgi:beta-propeller repeat-containing protein